MLKLTSKKIMMFLITIIMFLIGVKDVRAETCVYAAPMPYINENNIPTKFQLDYTHEYGIFNRTATSQVYVEEFVFKCDTETDCCTLGVKTDDFIYMKIDEKDPASNPWYFDGYFGGGGVQNYYYPGDCSEKYVLFNTVENIPESLIADETQYKQKLNDMYLNKIRENVLYGLYVATTNNNSEKPAYFFVNHIESVGGVVAVNTSQSEPYESTHYNELLNALRGMDGGESAIENLTAIGSDRYPVVLDGERKNNLSYTKAYYEATKNKWYTYMQNSINNPNEAGDSTRREYFRKWYRNVSRYIFEDDLELFKKYFTYLYQYEDETAMKELGGGSVDTGRSNYNKYLSAINGIIELHNVNQDNDQYLNDRCSALCPNDNSNAQTQCMSGSVAYRSCVAANDTCDAQCEHIGSASAQEDCYEGCMRSNLGEEAYNELIEAQNIREEEIENSRNDAISQIVDNLSRVDLPSLNGIEFDQEGYEVDCEDVVIFHQFYNILRILAPVLVIVLGSLDYTKAVMASDENKMQEFKKKFPKRLLLLILLIVIPIVISIILDLFAPFDAENSKSLMECIIRGS